MIRILTIIGTRPQIIKSSVLSKTIRKHFSNEIEETILFTGEDKESNMSRYFFDELSIEEPKYSLDIASDSHGKTTSEAIYEIEKIIIEEKPDAIILYGDSNSTLAGGIAASKLQIPIIHIEAGLRSFNKNMHEEINRITVDHLSTLLFTPTLSGINNLIQEGFSLDINNSPSINKPNLFHTGDLMYDNYAYYSRYIKENPDKNKDLFRKYRRASILCTIHREANIRDSKRMNSIFEALLEISKKDGVFIPLHPKTAKVLEEVLDGDIYAELEKTKNIRIIGPVPYLDMIYLISSVSVVITDSAGVQKEAYFAETPSVVLRDETEWMETIENGCARLAGADRDKIIEDYQWFAKHRPTNYQKLFGDGNAAKSICNQLIKYL